MAADPNDLTIQNESIADGVLVRVDGRIAARNAATVRQHLADLTASEPRRLVIDLEDADSVDSAGVAVLVEMLRRQRGHGGKLVLSGMNGTVRSVFEISRLDKIFPITADTASAQEV